MMGDGGESASVFDARRPGKLSRVRSGTCFDAKAATGGSARITTERIATSADALEPWRRDDCRAFLGEATVEPDGHETRQEKKPAEAASGRRFRRGEWRRRQDRGRRFSRQGACVSPSLIPPRCLFAGLRTTLPRRLPDSAADIGRTWMPARECEKVPSRADLPQQVLYREPSDPPVQSYDQLGPRDLRLLTPLSARSPAD